MHLRPRWEGRFQVGPPHLAARMLIAQVMRQVE